MLSSSTVVAAYLLTAAVAAVMVFVVSKRVSDTHRPPAHRLGLSVAAGMLWPLLILGLLEFASFVAYTKVQHDEAELPVDVRA